MLSYRRMSVLAAVYLLVSCLSGMAWADKSPSKSLTDDNKSLTIMKPQGKKWIKVQNPKARIKEFLSRGGQDAGGGNSYEAEFKTLGNVILGNIRNLPNVDAIVDFTKLSKAIDEVQIIIEPSMMYLNGVERQAVNLKSLKVILVSAGYWEKLNVNQKKILVIHEYLRFCDVDDSTYAISSVFAAYQELTLIPPAISNIYHTVEFPKSVWEFEEDNLVDVKFDQAETQVRLMFPSEQGPFTVSMVVPDAVLGAKRVYYTTGPSENIDSEDNKRAIQCAQKIQAHEPLKTIILGERDTIIVDCH